jgi:hypothetical protein
MEKNRTDPGLHRWFIPAIQPGSALAKVPVMDGPGAGSPVN